MSRAFLGTGLKFPLELDTGNELVLSSQGDDIEEAIWLILSTGIGERVMRPEFGCGIHRYLFAPSNARTAGLVASAVREALTRWEPRIAIKSVNVTPDGNDSRTLLIDID